jgi:hypothetical protein
MRKMRLLGAALCVAAVSGLALQAESQPASGAHAAKAKKGKKGKDKADAGEPEPPPALPADPQERYQELQRRLGESREARRTAHRAEIHRMWGVDAAKNAPLRAELQRNAWRMARLLQMRMLAEAASNGQLIERIDRVIEKERNRHARRVQELSSGPAPAPKPSAGGAK